MAFIGTPRHSAERRFAFSIQALDNPPVTRSKPISDLVRPRFRVELVATGAMPGDPARHLARLLKRLARSYSLICARVERVEPESRS